VSSVSVMVSIFFEISGGVFSRSGIIVSKLATSKRVTVLIEVLNPLVSGCRECVEETVELFRTG